MTNNEIAELYVKRIGCNQETSPNGSVDFLIPWLILDPMLQIFNKEIKPIECKHQLQKYKTAWYNAYHEFNTSLFCKIPEAKDDIIEKMDALWEYIEHDVFIAKVQAMNMAKEEPLDIQDKLASMEICLLFALEANSAWRAVYKRSANFTNKTEPKPNRSIERIIRNIDLFAKEWFHIYGSTKVDMNSNPEFIAAVKVICKKIARWCFIKDAES